MRLQHAPIRLAALAVLAFSVTVPALAQRGRGAPPTIGEGPWDLQTETGKVHVSVLTRDLESPWSLVFLPNGDMLVGERPGRLRVIRGGKHGIWAQ